MFETGIQKSFIARHFLIGGDWGAENQLHSHHFRLSVSCQGEHLDQHRYLMDICELKKIVDALTGIYTDQTLNHLGEFADQNPSLELFCRIIFDNISRDFRPDTVKSLRVVLWEDDFAWASYEHNLS